MVSWGQGSGLGGHLGLEIMVFVLANLLPDNVLQSFVLLWVIISSDAKAYYQVLCV